MPATRLDPARLDSARLGSARPVSAPPGTAVYLAAKQLRRRPLASHWPRGSGQRHKHSPRGETPRSQSRHRGPGMQRAAIGVGMHALP